MPRALIQARTSDSSNNLRSRGEVITTVPRDGTGEISRF